MTREFNKNQRYDARPPYRGTPSNNNNNRYEAEQPSGPTRPRLNRAMVDRAWENGAPHRHADYKARNPNEAGTNQTHYGPNTQRNWRKPQPSEHAGNNNSSYERGNGARPSRYDSRTQPPQPHRSDSSSNGYQGSRSRFTQPNNSFADRPPYRDQRGHGNEENTYNARNGHPNFSHTPPQPNRGRYNQEPDRQGPPRNGSYSYRTNPTNQVNNTDRRDQRGRPYEQRETPYRNNRFEGGQGRQQTNDERPADFNKPRYPTNPATPGRQQENRNVRPSERFEGDYEQFNHAPAPSPSRSPRDTRKQERPEHRAPQPHVKRMGKPVEVERHVTPLPDGRVLKGSRPAQRKNAQFWTGVSQDAEQLVNQVQAKEETSSSVSDTTADMVTGKTAEKAVDGQEPAIDASVEEHTPAPHAVSSRAKAAKRAASAARRGKSDKPVSKGPRPSQRGFKWPTPPIAE
jgi:hypothetical protein